MSEEEVERILRVAGLASAPLDPSSLEALRQLSRERQKAAPAGVSASASASSLLASAKAVVDPIPVLSDASMSPKNSDDDVVTSHTLAQMLQVQTKLLLETQQQLKKLTQKVDSLEEQLLYAGSGGHSGPGSAGNGKAFARPPFTAQDPVGNMPMNMNRNNMPVQPGQLQLEAWYETFCPTFLKRLIVLGQLFWTESKGVVRPFDTALLFKVVCMCLVAYGRTSSRKKLQQQKNADDPSWFLFVRINAKWFFLVFGLLYHTRYLHFLYQFVYVDNYPMRVLWYGEDMALEHPAHDDDNEVDDEHHGQRPHGGQHNGPPHHRRNPRLRRRRHGQPNNNGQGDQPAWWRAWIQETFLMGVIQPRQQPDLQDGGGVPPQDGAPAAQGFAPGRDVPRMDPQNEPQHEQQQQQQQQQPPVAPNLILVGIQDVLYLFGSFFMSLFVVWHPRRPQEAPPVEPAAPQPQERPQQQEQEDIDNIDE